VKGAVENINRKIRRFLPTKTNPKTLCQKTVGQIMKKLNTTLRKYLNLSMPYEIFNAKIKKSGAFQCWINLLLTF
jgi:IS30 family transposase